MSGERSDPVAMAASVIGFTRALNVRMRETPQGTGLALAELNVLGGLEKGYDLSSTLVQKLLLDAPRVSRIVDGFVGSGYVVREPDPDDRRRYRLQLTPAGLEILARGRAELAAAMEDLLAGLTDEERAGFERAVPGMRRVLAGRTAALANAE
jgi:MarR family transcriptional regulator, organic hydroperoxide resistance regulator